MEDLAFVLLAAILLIGNVFLWKVALNKDSKIPEELDFSEIEPYRMPPLKPEPKEINPAIDGIRRSIRIQNKPKERVHLPSMIYESYNK